MKRLAIAITFFTLFPFAAFGEEKKAQATGEDIFVSRCGLCHQRPKPTSLNLEQWKAVLVTMNKRMAQLGMEPLTGEETQSLEGYFANVTGGK